MAMILEGKIKAPGTILLVEDEEFLRSMLRTVLEGSGYIVLEAAWATDALTISECYHGPIHLLLTDLIMPKMNGTHMAELIKMFRPGIRILFMSGYSGEVVVKHGLDESRADFIQKPFTPTQLSNKLRSLLENSQSSLDMCKTPSTFRQQER